MARSNAEELLQRSVVQYLDAVLLPPAFYTAFPAGGGGRVRGGVLKAMGLKAGVPDLLVLRPSYIATIVLGLELKSATGRVSPEQWACRRALADCCVHTQVCRSLADVRAALKDAGFGLRGHTLWEKSGSFRLERARAGACLPKA